MTGTVRQRVARRTPAIAIAIAAQLAISASVPPGRAVAQIPEAVPEITPSSVVIAGSLQSELGCAGDWDPACAATGLTFSASDQVWQATFAAPAGSFEYLGALNGSWTESYGQGGVLGGANIPLTLGAPTSVKFYYSDLTHWVTDDVFSVIATVPGDFQSELGCPGDWQPDCLRSWLQDLDGDGRYHATLQGVAAGSYSCKVAIRESWDENYGQGGVPGGPTIPFSHPHADYRLDFAYDAVTHILTVTSSLFAHGFESGNLTGWSASVP